MGENLIRLNDSLVLNSNKVLRRDNKAAGYEIMHMERVVAGISSIGEAEIFDEAFMPYDLYLEETESNDIDAMMNNLNNFYHWCASRVLSLDRKYAKEILNSIGAVQAVTDKDRADISLSRHPENWGFLVDNRRNQYVSLYPLMDFNQCFLSYDTIDGANCQTVLPLRMNQREAAIEAVKHIGLRQICGMDMSKFETMEQEAKMFQRRLAELKRYVQQ